MPWKALADTVHIILLVDVTADVAEASSKLEEHHPFTDTSLCRLGRYRLQIWEEPLRFFNWLVHNRKTLYLHN